MVEYISFNHGERPLAEYVKIHVLKNPDKVAVIFYGKEMTWKNLEDWSNKLANAFADMGYKKSDRLAVFLQSCPQCYPE